MQQTYAAIPTKDGIVVSCWTNLFRLSKRTHRVFEEREHRVRWLSGAELRFGTPLVGNSCVVEPLVGITELLEALFGFAVAVGRNARKLIRKCEPEQPQRKLMLRFDRQNIATDRLGFFRLTEAAVELCLGDGLSDTCGGDAFQLVTHGAFLSS